jgi:hypothetical protein
MAINLENFVRPIIYDRIASSRAAIAGYENAT